MTVALLVWGCQHQAPSDQVLRIGLILDHDATSGQSSLEAATLALEEVLVQGGVARPDGRRVIELVTETVATPDEAVAAARRLTGAGVVAIVGPSLSRHAIPVATVAEFAQVPMLSPKSTHPITTRGKRFVFRTAFTDDYQGRALAEMAHRRIGASRAAVIYDVASDYNRHIAQVFIDTFEGQGGEVSAIETYTTGENDFAPYLQRLLAAAPDLVFLPNYQHEIVLQARQLRTQGFVGTLLGGDGWVPGEPADPALEGAYFCQHWHATLGSETPSARRFVSTFERRFGHPPDDLAALTYDALGLLFESLAKTPRLDPLALRDELQNLSGFSGVTGTISFRDGGGDPEKTLLIFRIVDGRPLLLEGSTQPGGSAAVSPPATAPEDLS